MPILLGIPKEDVYVRMCRLFVHSSNTNSWTQKEREAINFYSIERL
jgi:hypothetical protein